MNSRGIYAGDCFYFEPCNRSHIIKRDQQVYHHSDMAKPFAWKVLQEVGVQIFRSRLRRQTTKWRQRRRGRQKGHGQQCSHFSTHAWPIFWYRQLAFGQAWLQWCNAVVIWAYLKSLVFLKMFGDVVVVNYAGFWVIFSTLDVGAFKKHLLGKQRCASFDRGHLI